MDVSSQLKGPVVQLYNWSIDDTQAEEVARILRQNAQLRALNLGGNQLGDLGVMRLFPVLVEASSLRTLHLHRNGLGDGAATILAEALKLNAAYEEVYLGDNEIADIGAEALALALAKSRLVKLKLNQNAIGDRGAEKLADALMQTQSLRELDLSGNRITDAGAARLQDAEAGHPSLRRLALEKKKEVVEELVLDTERGEFLMEVDTSQKKFGIHIQVDKANKILKISSIDAAGMVAVWNQTALEPVKEGDHIIRVNGCRAIDEILAECRKAQLQRLVLKRAAHVLRKNQRVRLCACRDRPQDVGKAGKTLQWFGSVMRWKVRLDDGPVVMCAGSDLEALEEASEWSIGDLVDHEGERGVVYEVTLKQLSIACLSGLRSCGPEELQRLQMADFYAVYLKKVLGSRLGLDVSPHEKSLEITKIGHGLVEQWNGVCSSESLVKVGDRILQVNSVTGEAGHAQLLAECKEKDELLLRLQREPREAEPRRRLRRCETLPSEP